MQRALLQYFVPENKPLVIKALTIAARKDLIGTGKNCHVTPMYPNAGKTVRKNASNVKHTNKTNKSTKHKNKRF